MAVTTYEVDGRTVAITNADRVLFPDDGITKGDLVEYHHRVADALVPHVGHRPLMLQRFPSGIDGSGFYQKDAKGVPGWIDTVEARKEGGVVHHPVISDAASLLALTNLGTVSFHRWPARADDLEHPDLLIVDLDPSSDDFDDVRAAARDTRSLFEDLDLASFLQVTGSRGIHVIAPIRREAPTEAVAAFAHAIAHVLAARHPDTLTAEGRKAQRRGRLYVDVARNGWAQTAVSPYSVRPRAGAPVATPITWDELDDPDLRPDGFTIADVPHRLARTGDPWADMARNARSLPSRVETLKALLAETAG